MKRVSFYLVESGQKAPETKRNELMCSAHGCPNRWSVRTEGAPLCSAHDKRPAHLWPTITEEQRIGYPIRPTYTERADVAEFGQRGADGRGWARALRECEQMRGGTLPNGSPMTRLQREAWRAVLRNLDSGPREESR